MSRTRRYHLSEGASEPREVTEAEFVQSERRAGFINTLGQQDKPATSGFAANGISGHITYEDQQ